MDLIAEIFRNRSNPKKLFLKYHPDKKPHGNAEKFMKLRDLLNKLESKSPSWQKEVKNIKELRSILNDNHSIKDDNFNFMNDNNSMKHTHHFDFDFKNPFFKFQKNEFFGQLWNDLFTIKPKTKTKTKSQKTNICFKCKSSFSSKSKKTKYCSSKCRSTKQKK